MLTPFQQQQIQQLIKQTFCLWKIENIAMDDRYDNIIAVTVIIQVDSTIHVPFQSPVNWKCLQIKKHQYICCHSLPQDYKI